MNRRKTLRRYRKQQQEIKIIAPTTRMRYPFQTPGRVISCQNEQSYRLYTTSERVFVPGSGTVTGVNSHRYDSLRYEILCWNHACERIQSGVNPE